ncbi:YfhO family protein [Candidatus Collierbacteria bacterium]|nr:YfhO family protein [Candidatus Collierbacteria bacterium]
MVKRSMSLLNYKNYNRYLPLLIIVAAVLLAFAPIFKGKIPLNARNLVSFFSPWYYEKFEGFPVGVPSRPGILDQLRIYYPYMRLTQDAYRHWELPLWNPFNFAGNPHMAEWQSGVFYPLHILLPLLSLPVYWTLFQLTAFFLAGLFTYWYLFNLNLGKPASIFGATTFMLSEFMITWNMEVITAPHSILWLPLILLSIDKIIDPSSIIPPGRASGRRHHPSSIKRWWLVGLTGIVFSILAGYWQTTLYVMSVTVVYILYRIWQKKLLLTPYSLLLLAWFPFALALTAFHLLPTNELLGRSSREYINLQPRIQEIMKGYLLPARHLITLFAPDYFGHEATRNYFARVGGGWYYEHVIFVGTVPLLLAVVALFAKKKIKIRNDVLFWVTVILISASFSFKIPWAEAIFRYKVPVLSTGIANRILFVEAFGLSVLAAIGLSSLSDPLNLKRAIKIGLVGTAGIAVLFFNTLITKTSLGAADPVREPQQYLISLRNMILPTGVYFMALALLVTGIWKKRFIAAAILGIIVISFAQNLYQFRKFTPFSEMMFVYPVDPIIGWLQKNSGLNRFIGYNGKFFGDNFATQFGIYSIEGYDSLNDYKRSVLLHSAVEGKLDLDLPRSADVILGRNLENLRTVKLMKLFGIRYLVDHPEWLDFGPTAGKKRLPDESQKLVFQDGDFRIWEFLDAYPRAFLAGQYEVIPDGKRLISRLYEDSFDPRRNILLGEDPGQDFSIYPDELAKVKITRYRPTKIVFETSSASDQLLFLSDTWYPGWQAKLENGQELKVLTADYALRAVPVPAGDHTITMWYFPESFKKGLIISLITVITIIIFIPQSGILLRRIKAKR